MTPEAAGGTNVPDDQCLRLGCPGCRLGDMNLRASGLLGKLIPGNTGREQGARAGRQESCSGCVTKPAGWEDSWSSPPRRKSGRRSQSNVDELPQEPGTPTPTSHSWGAATGGVNSLALSACLVQAKRSAWSKALGQRVADIGSSIGGFQGSVEDTASACSPVWGGGGG